MKVNKAVSIRIKNLLTDKNLSKYKLCKDTAIPKETMKTIFRDRNDGINLKTVLLIVHGLDMTAAEFFNDELFDYKNLDFD